MRLSAPENAGAGSGMGGTGDGSGVGSGLGGSGSGSRIGLGRTSGPPVVGTGSSDISLLRRANTGYPVTTILHSWQQRSDSGEGNHYRDY